MMKTSHLDRLMKGNPGLALLLAPLMGLAFVIFLPLAGFWLTGRVLVERVHAEARGLRRKSGEARA